MNSNVNRTKRGGNEQRVAPRPWAVFIILLAATPAWSTTYYLDCAVGSSGNGSSWSTAWKSLSNITGLAAGDLVYISGSAGCSTYNTSQWNPVNGSASNPIIYRMAQDSGHTNPVTINLTGAPGMAGTSNQITGVWIDGNLSGKQNITLQGTLGAAGNGTKWNGSHLSYLVMNRTKVEAGVLNGLEIDHCNIDLPVNSDHFYTSSTSGGAIGYTLNLIHDNVLHLRQQTGNSGIGDDGFQWLENASVYNNFFIAVMTSAQNIQHQDGIQTCGSYMAIYGNYFENIGNYPVYGDCFGSGSHWRVYNNISSGAGLPLQHFAMGFEQTSGSTLSDFIIANNTAYSSTGSNLCVSLGGGYSGNSVKSSYIVNNLCYNTSVQSIPGGGSITVSNNYEGTANVSFVNTANYPNQDFNIQPNSTNAINRGINPAPSYLTSFYTTDASGVTRPNPWDLGAYESGGGPPPSGPVPPTNLTGVVVSGTS
jgi:hypothetical protein